MSELTAPKTDTDGAGGPNHGVRLGGHTHRVPTVPVADAGHQFSGGSGEHEHDHHEHDHHEPEQLREALAERLVSITSMSRELKAYTALGALILLTLAALALFRNDLTGHLITANILSEDGDSPASMSKLLFWVTVVFVCLAWAFITTAAARAGWVTRVLSGVALGLAFGPQRLAVTELGGGYQLGVIAGLVAIVLILVLTWFPERAMHDPNDPKVLRRQSTWCWVRKLIFPATFLVFLGVYALVWGGSKSAGDGENFPWAVGNQLYNIQWLLIPIVSLAGADFGDWGSFAAGRAIKRVRTWLPEPAFFAIIAVVAAGIGYDGYRISQSDDGAGALTELALAGVVGFFALLLIVLTKAKSSWPAHVPYYALAGCIVIDTVAQYVISERIANDPDGTLSDGWDAITWLCLAGASLVMLAACRRRLPNWLLVGGIYATMIGVIYVCTDLFSVADIVHPFGWTEDTAPWVGFEGLKMAGGLVTLAVLAAAVAMRRTRQWTQPIVMLLRLTISFQVLEWIDSLYGGAVHSSGTAKVAGQLALAAAVVMVLALSWEFAASGESITNGHGRRFPRDTRVLLFVGYVVITAATSVFYSSVGEMREGKWELLESQFEAENYVRDGLLFLGTPLVVTIFIISFNRWRQQQAAEKASAVQSLGREPALTGP
jgi:hypothetical protein